MASAARTDSVQGNASPSTYLGDLDLSRERCVDEWRQHRIALYGTLQAIDRLVCAQLQGPLNLRFYRPFDQQLCLQALANVITELHAEEAQYKAVLRRLEVVRRSSGVVNPSWDARNRITLQPLVVMQNQSREDVYAEIYGVVSELYILRAHRRYLQEEIDTTEQKIEVTEGICRP